MSSRLVLDASAALEVVLLRPSAAGILDLLDQAGVVYAPDLFATETANALWKHVKSGGLRREEAFDLLEEACDLVDSFLIARDLAPEALATAIAHGRPVYDSLYAVAARRTGATVVTLDQRLKRLLDAMKVPSEMPGL